MATFNEGDRVRVVNYDGLDWPEHAKMNGRVGTVLDNQYSSYTKVSIDGPVTDFPDDWAFLFEPDELEAI